MCINERMGTTLSRRLVALRINQSLSIDDVNAIVDNLPHLLELEVRITVKDSLMRIVELMTSLVRLSIADEHATAEDVLGSIPFGRQKALTQLHLSTAYAYQQ